MEYLKGQSYAHFCFASLLMTCPYVLHVRQSNADDGTLNTANDNIDNIRRDLQQSLHDVSAWCCKNRMALNPTKTKCMLMATRQKHQKKKQLPLNLKFETTPIEQVSKHRLLGVTVDEQLKWQMHINNICRTVSRNIFLLSKLSQIVSQKSTHYVTYELCFKCMGWMCLCAHEAAVFSPQTCRKILDANS